MEKRWWILDRDLVPIRREDLPPRPADAQDADGDPFTPWYETGPHLHRDPDGVVEGIHAFGTLEEVQDLFSWALKSPWITGERGSGLLPGTRLGE